ncbi:MAG: hypothetical protein ABIH50_00310 [bacterium]
MDKKLNVSLLLFALILVALSNGCGRSSYDSDYSSTKIKSLAVTPTKVFARAGDSVNINLTGTDENGTAIAVTDYTVTQVPKLGNINNSGVYTLQYPGKTKLQFRSTKYVYSSSIKSESTTYVDDYYLDCSIDVEILPKEEIAPTAPNIKLNKVGSDYLEINVEQDENIEGFEFSYGTDNNASSEGIRSNKSSAGNEYIWDDDSYNTNNPNSYSIKMNYNFGPNCIKSDNTYYFKIRGINRYGIGEWSEIKVLSEGINSTNHNFLEIDNNALNNQTNQMTKETSTIINATSEATLNVTVYNSTGYLANTGEVWVYIWTPYTYGVVPTNVAWKKAVDGKVDFKLPAGDYGWSADQSFSANTISSAAYSDKQNITLNSSNKNQLTVILGTKNSTYCSYQ